MPAINETTKIDFGGPDYTAIQVLVKKSLEGLADQGLLFEPKVVGDYLEDKLGFSAQVSTISHDLQKRMEALVPKTFTFIEEEPFVKAGTAPPVLEKDAIAAWLETDPLPQLVEADLFRPVERTAEEFEAWVQEALAEMKRCDFRLSVWPGAWERHQAELKKLYEQYREERLRAVIARKLKAKGTSHDVF